MNRGLSNEKGEDARPTGDGAPPPWRAQFLLACGLALVVLVVLLLPPLAMLEGGYTWTQGLFYPRQVHAVARVGGRVSGALFLIGAVGLLAGLIWPRLSLWFGAATRLRVLAVHGGMIVLALACRVETSVLLARVHAREDRAVDMLYRQVRPGMTVASVQVLAAGLDRAIQAAPAGMALYEDMLGAERGSMRGCAIEFSAPERFSGVRMVAPMAACGHDPDARVGRVYLFSHKKLVASK